MALEQKLAGVGGSCQLSIIPTVSSCERPGLQFWGLGYSDAWHLPDTLPVIRAHLPFYSFLLSPVLLLPVVSALGHSGNFSHVLTITAAVEDTAPIAVSTFAIATILMMLPSFTLSSAPLLCQPPQVFLFLTVLDGALISKLIKKAQGIQHCKAGQGRGDTQTPQSIGL